RHRDDHRQPQPEHQDHGPQDRAVPGPLPQHRQPPSAARPSSASCAARSTVAGTERTPASEAANGIVRYRSCRTAASFAVAGLAFNSSILSSTVFQDASTSTITSGSAATIFSQLIDVHVFSTPPAKLSRPNSSSTICGAPIPPPTYGVSEPEEYHNAVRSPGTGLTESSASRCEAISRSARAGTPKMAPTCSIWSNTSSKPSRSGWYPGSRHAAGSTYVSTPSDCSDSRSPASSAAKLLCQPAITRSGLCSCTTSWEGTLSDNVRI